jgi:hypothetical protein
MSKYVVDSVYSVESVAQPSNEPIPPVPSEALELL